MSNDADLVRELTGIEPARAEPLALGAAASTGGFIGGLWQDLRFGARLLVKNRGASLVVIITLALAIAANAIVFGFADLLLLRPLPIDNADRVVTIYGVDRRLGHNREWLSISDYLELRRQATSLADVSAMTTRQASLVGAGEPRAVMVNFVTTNVLSTWGLAAFSGRTFLPDEGTPGRANVAILSHRFWTAHFAADPAAVGRTLTVNGERCTVVGVLSPNIEIGDLGEIDLWLPLDTTQAWESRSERVAEVFALRRPETTLEQVNAELTTISDRLRRADPLNHVDWQLRAMTIREATVGATTWIILALLGVVTLLVLVVACANIATVMLARASARRKEIALRLALGATRGRLVRQLLSEGMLLGLASGACGLGFAYAGLTAFKLLSPDSFFQRLAVNGNLLAFAIMGMFVGFASIGLIVAVAGVYGVTAFSVNQRGHEIGVRMALGATAANVVSLFISRSLRLILIGVAVGVAAGWAMGRTMNSILVETSPSDPATYTTVIGLIVMSGLVTSLVPASRAVSIDPIAVLKRE
ncbi:MAG: hypothetical protein AUF76_08520 [Acidobacteria bacterium 13_1_20CM_2_65_9]|nr:MAG: hypothetical protein AUF76_08520 [Acidobacteria bacterium 13_1_20CM_2_65_9]